MKKFLLTIFIITGILILGIVSLSIKQVIVNYRINNDISDLFADEKKLPVSVPGIEVFKQNISCGYASIEMFAKWLGHDITEQSLFESNNGQISTAMGKGFVLEMNKQFPDYTTTRYANLKNTEVIEKIYKSLTAGMPVPIELAAIYSDGETRKWTLHFSIVTAMDISNDQITVCNPYGYEEVYTLNEFLRATRFDSYENMELYFKLGFTAGVFNKNTIYIVDKVVN